MKVKIEMDDGECVVALPAELLARMGWKMGDLIEYRVEADTIVLGKKTLKPLPQLTNVKSQK